MSRGISGEAQTELLRLLRDRYKGSSKSDKTKILDEFVAVSGFHRKHAIRLLTGPPPTEQSSHLSRRVYDEAVQQVLIVAWEASDRICGKRLKSVLPSIVEAMERHGHLDVEPIVRVNRKLKCPLFRILKCPLVDKEMAVSIILCISPYLATVPVSLQAHVPTTPPCVSPSAGNSRP